MNYISKDTRPKLSFFGYFQTLLRLSGVGDSTEAAAIGALEREKKLREKDRGVTASFVELSVIGSEVLKISAPLWQRYNFNSNLKVDFVDIPFKKAFNKVGFLFCSP